MPTLSSRLFNIIDASILIAALFGVFYLFGYFYYERLFFALGLPKSILMPSYNVIVTRGWIVAWTLDVRIINIVSIIIFTTILAYFFYLPRIKTYVDKIFLDRNTENKKSKTINFILYCSNKLKYVCILIVCFLFVFFYVNDRAYEQANRTSNCFSSGIYNEAACRFYPPLEILTDIPVDGSKQFIGRIISSNENNIALLKCGKKGEVTVYKVDNIINMRRYDGIQEELIKSKQSCKVNTYNFSSYK